MGKRPGRYARPEGGSDPFADKSGSHGFHSVQKVCDRHGTLWEPDSSTNGAPRSDYLPGTSFNTLRVLADTSTSFMCTCS